MYAIVEAGGKQFKVTKGDRFFAETFRSRLKEGGTIKINKVLFIKEGNTVHIGKPHLHGASVLCEVLAHSRSKKVIAYKYRKRKSSKTKIGHRQDLIELRVKEIEFSKG